MRFLTSLLFALLLAVALAIGAYAASWSLRREPRTDVAPPAAPPAAALPTPTRLVDSADFARTMPPAPERGDPTFAELTIEVVGMPPAWRSPSAGLAVATRGGAGGIAWSPLPDAPGGDGVLRFRQACAIGDEVVVALAPARTNALRSYFARAATTVAAASTLRLDATGAEVVIRRAADAHRSGPFQLRRDDDESWLPADASAGVHLDAPLRLWLGAGAYTLRDAAAPAHRAAFTVPATIDVAVSDPPRPAADDRR